MKTPIRPMSGTQFLIRKVILCVLFATLLPALAAFGAEKGLPPLRIVVMDPLCDRLACDCVEGYAQRKYDVLGEFLQRRLGRRVEISYAEALSSPHARMRQGIDLIIGKLSLVEFDAKKAKLDVRTIAMLTGKDGKATGAGLFVVRHADPAKTIEDLAGYRMLFGPEDSDEKRSAAMATLEAFDVPVPRAIAARNGCNTAALAVVEKDADVAVISGYAMPLLEGCGTIDKGSLRIVGRTDPVPLIGVFATDRVTEAAAQRLTASLLEVARHPALLTALESRHGFLRLPAVDGKRGKRVTGWTDWRGSRRDAVSDDVPESLPAEKRLLWSRTMTGYGMAGLAVDGRYVVTADKDFKEVQDVFRCLDADTGRQIWKLAYPAAAEMDFTNSPRANPVICQDVVYLLGAFGNLYCVTLGGGKIVWQKHLARGRINPKPAARNEDLLPDTSTPVVHGGLVFGSCEQLVCLDLNDGLKLLWKVDDEPFDAYSSFIAGNGRVLVTTQTGKLCLLDATKRRFTCLATLDLFNDVAEADRDVWSHPALIGNRLYIRNALAVYCFLLR